jgi:hypothetical protein
MDPKSVMNDVQCSGLVVAIVAAARQKWPRIDGLLVLLLSVSLGVAFADLLGPDTIRGLIQHGFLIAGIASGTMTVAKYHATAGALGPIQTIEASPLISKGPGPERGIAHAWAVVALGAATAALIVAAGIVYGCSAAKPVCEAINLADQACAFVTVNYVDDAGAARQEQIPKAELRATAEKLRAVRAQRDAGP